MDWSYNPAGIIEYLTLAQVISGGTQPMLWINGEQQMVLPPSLLYYTEYLTYVILRISKQQTTIWNTVL